MSLTTSKKKKTIKISDYVKNTSPISTEPAKPNKQNSVASAEKVVKISEFTSPTSATVQTPTVRTNKQKYTVNKTKKASVTADAFSAKASDPFSKTSAKKDITQLKVEDPFAKTAETVNSITYNYLGTTPVEKMVEDRNNTDDFNKIIYEAVTNDKTDGKTLSEISDIAKYNNGVTPKIETYSSSLGVLSGSDIDALIEKYTEYDSLYKTAISEIQKSGKLSADVDKKVSSAIDALKNGKLNDGETVIAKEYQSMLETVKNGDYALYFGKRYAQGAASGVTDAMSGIAITVKDAVSSLKGDKTESDKIQKIDNYLKENPSDRSKLYNQGTAFELANKIGVSTEDLNNYNFYTMSQRMAEDTEKSGGNLNELVKTIGGGIAETAGGMVTSQAFGNAFGKISNVTSVIDNIRNKQGLGKIMKDLFHITPQNAVYGLGTAGSETVSLAQERGYDPLNVVVSAAKGYAETTAENIGGIEELKWFDDLAAGKGFGKALTNHFINTLGEIGEEEITLISQNLIDKTLVNNDRSWAGSGGVFDPQEMLNTAVTSFAFGEIVGGAKLVSDIKQSYTNGKLTAAENEKAKKTLEYINGTLPENHRRDISKDNIKGATDKILQAQVDYLNELNDGIADRSEIQKGVTEIMNYAIKGIAFNSATTKQSALNVMSERGYTPSAVIENKMGDSSHLSEQAAAALNKITDKLDTEFASAWYGNDGVAAGREASGVYAKAAAVGDAVSAAKLAGDVLNGTLKGKKADKAIRQASALLPSSAAVDGSGTTPKQANNIISAAETYIVQTNEQTANISLTGMLDVIDAIGNAMDNQNVNLSQQARGAISDLMLKQNIDKNLETIIGDENATDVLSDILGMHIDGSTDVKTIRRKVRDMINTFASGNGKAFNAVAAQKRARAALIEKQLTRINADQKIITAFRNAIYNGKLTEQQAIAIASDIDAFQLYVRATAGKLSANPTIDDMIKAAGYVAGFDIGGFSLYYDRGYTETVESDTLVPGDEGGIYDPDTGTVTLNKKAPLDKKLAYRLAQEIVSVNYPEIDESVLKISKDGELFKKISESNKSKYTVIKEYLIEKFYGEEIHLSDGKIAIIDKRDARELSHLADDKKTAELSNLKEIIKRAKYSHSAEKVTHNKFSSFSYYSFSVEIDGERLDLLLNVGMAKNDGSHHIYDITKDKKRRAANQSSTGLSRVEKTDAMKNSSSINSISESNKNVNSLTDTVYNYMSEHGYNMDSERERVAKKYNPYMIEHRSRLNSSLLTEENLNHEIVADFLTKVFTEPAEMEKLADGDLDLAVDLAERVKVFADTTTDSQLKDFANDVCGQLITVIRSDDRADELQDVLHNRTLSGIDSPALYDSIDGGRIDFSERDEDSVVVKVKDWYNNLKRGFVDSGEAIARLGKLLDNEIIYHRYNNTKQSQDAIAYMLEKAQTDIEGNKIGKSLKDIFKPIIADKGKYEKFCLYMQYINNAERAVNGKAIFSDKTKEQSLERAESLLRSNPEFKAWADDVYKYNEGLMNWLIDSGLLTRDQYNEMKKQNPHYVPAFVVDTTKHDKPSFIESVVVKKTVKRAKGGAEKVMPLLDAMQMKTSQIIKEARMNMLALEIVDTMKRKDLLEDGPKGFTVKDPALEEFVYQITAVRDSKYYEPTKANGKYVTVNTNRKLKDDIKDLFSFADGKKNEARNIVSEYVRKLTYSETFVASDAEALAQELIDRAISPGANTDALYYQYPELRVDLANAKLYVPPETVNEIPDYSDFKNSLFGRVTLTTREGDGTHVDTAYTIWSGAYPELFDPDIINTTDQIYKIKEVIENLKKPPEVTLKQMHGESIGAVKAELTDNIKRLSIQAIKDAHSERAEIEKEVEAHAFATYDIGSTNNLEFAKGEQDGNRMVFYADGIRHTMDIGKGVFEGLKNISFDPDAKTALKPVQKLNDTFKKLVTSYNPFFSVRNFIRDLQDAAMYSSDTKRMLRNLPRAYKEIATNGEMWQLYQSLGGVGSSYFDFKKQIDLETDMSTKSKATRAYKRVSGIVEQINVAVEQAPRLAEFITVLEKSDGSYAAKLKALYAAADVTVNFGRSGIYSRFLNSTVVPFYNPGVQGLSRFVRMFTEKKGAKQLVWLSAKLVVLGFALGGINDLINAIWEAANDEEDETYDQLTDYQKQNNILIPIGDGRYIKIPKGRSLNVFGIGAQNVIDMAQGEDVDWIGSVKTAVGQISPNDLFTDNLVAPLIAAGNNRTWYDSSIESAADEQVEPSQRYDETTDYFSRWLGGVLNYSPKKIHYVLDAYSGVVGDYILPILTSKGNGHILENVFETAGSNFLVDGTTSNRISSDYYSLVDELTFEKNDTAITEPTAASISLRFMNSQTDAIRDLYDEIYRVNSSDLSPNEKAQQSRELKATLNGLMLNAIASEEVVYSAAEKIESKYAYKKNGTYYDNEGDELTYDKYIDTLYREVCHEVFGSEYALQTYNKDVYEKASEAVKSGATFDLYYDAYFDLKAIEGDIDFTKGTIKTGSARSNQWKYINTMDASRTEKTALAKTLLNIDEKKINKAKAAGVDEYDYIDFLCDTGSFSSDDDSTKKEKVLTYINRMSVSSKEKDALYLLAGYSEKTIYNVPWR